MINIHSDKLKTFFLIMLGASFIATLAMNLLIYPTFTKMITDATESKSIMVANHLSNMIIPKGSELFITHMVQDNNDKIYALFKEFSLSKLKIFVSSGEIIFSTDQEDVGTFNKYDYFHNEVASGKTYTQLIHKQDKSLEGQEFKYDTVETYVPIMKGNRFIGALEIYYDVTAQTTVIRNNILLFNILSVGFLVAFLLISLIIVRRLDNNILERKNAQDFLKMTNLDLKREIEQRLSTEKAKEALIFELEEALLNLKVLKGLVPICSFCKNIRNDAGFWERMEEYIEKHSDAEFSHGLCPDCAAKQYPELHLDEDDETYTKRMKDQENQKEEDDSVDK